MEKGIKFRIYPTEQQKELLNQTFGCCRFVYNRGLSMRREAYEEGKSVNYGQTSSMLTELKRDKDFSFLKDVDSIALQQELRDLDRAYKNFFAKRAGIPKFKSKHDHHRSYRTINQHDSIRIAGRYIRLPKVGYVKVRQSMETDSIHHATVEQTQSGKYFVVLNVDFEPEPLPETEKKVGLDVGIRNFCTDSKGNITVNPKFLEGSEEKLEKEMRRFSRMKPGSKNREKQRRRVARAHERIVNQRNDFLHKVSTALIHENQVICVEDLKVQNMVRNHRLAKSIQSVSWSRFFTMLEYKATWYGRTIIRVPTFYPSSQTCHECGYRNRDVKDLKIRTWICPACGTVHDRDVNAAKNILSKGLSLLEEAV